MKTKNINDIIILLFFLMYFRTLNISPRCPYPYRLSLLQRLVFRASVHITYKKKNITEHS